MLVYNVKIYNRAWWNVFDTYQLQGLSRQRGLQGEVQDVELTVSENANQLAYNIAATAVRQGTLEVPTKKIWQEFRLADNKGMQTSVGMYLKELGVDRVRRGRNGVYHFNFSRYVNISQTQQT